MTLNSGRNSIAFLMILLVSLGHGVVKPSLGSSIMRSCLVLTGMHFVFGTLYGTVSLVSGDVNSKWVIFLILPLSATMTAFYSWTMKGLEDTIAHLTTRRQGVKLLMYKSNSLLMDKDYIIFWLVQSLQFWLYSLQMRLIYLTRMILNGFLR